MSIMCIWALVLWVGRVGLVFILAPGSGWNLSRCATDSVEPNRMVISLTYTIASCIAGSGWMENMATKVLGL